MKSLDKINLISKDETDNNDFVRVLRGLLHLSNYMDVTAISILLRAHYDNYMNYIKTPHKRVWTNLSMPNEIFHAMGLAPIFSENIAALLSAVKMTPEYLDIQAKNITVSGLCTYIACTIGVLEKGLIPLPAIFVVPSDICEDEHKVVEMSSKKYNIPAFSIDIPYNYNERNVNYVAEQLRELIDFIEINTGEKLDHSELKKSIRRSNIAYKYWRKSAELRENNYLMHGASGLKLLGAHSRFGSQKGIEITQKLYLELLKRKMGKTEFVLRRSKIKLLWMHLFPYYENSLMRYIEDKLGCDIVFEEINYVPRKQEFDSKITYSMSRPLDEEKPFESMAEKLILTPIHGRVENRLQNLEELRNRYSFDGAIHFSHIGCKPSCGDVMFIRDYFKNKGIPFLELTGDNIDHRNISIEQLRTRVDAFIEILRSQMS